MKATVTSFEINTTKRTEFVDITYNIRSAIKKSSVKDGRALIFCPHTTAGITINEGHDHAAASDIIYFLNKLIPPSVDFKHAEGNSDAHIKASLMGSSVSIIIQEGDLYLGKWQAVFLTEFDGPKNRTVCVQCIS